MRDKKVETSGVRGRFGRIFSAVGLVIGIGILIYLALYVRREIGLGALMAAVRPGWLLAAAFCIPVFEGLDTCIYYGMGRASGCPVTVRGCLDAVVIGEFYYRMGLAGAPVQLGLLLSAGYTPGAAAAVYTWKAVLNTLVYTLYAVVAILARLLVFRRETAPWAIWSVGVLVAVYVLLCAAVLALSIRPGPVKRLARRALEFLARHIPPLGRAGRVDKAMGALEDFCAELDAMRGKRRVLFQAAGLMLLEMTSLFSIPIFLYFGLGLTGYSPWELLLTQCLVMVLARIVVLPGNAGGAEGSFYLFMSGAFGALLPAAVVLWRCAAFLEVLALGGIWSIVRSARRAGRR